MNLIPHNIGVAISVISCLFIRKGYGCHFIISIQHSNPVSVIQTYIRSLCRDALKHITQSFLFADRILSHRKICKCTAYHRILSVCQILSFSEFHIIFIHMCNIAGICSADTEPKHRISMRPCNILFPNPFCDSNLPVCRFFWDFSFHP